MSELPQIPGYRIIRKLGHGGMADVYLGVQENLEREVAVKVLVPSLFRDDKFSLRFLKEAQTAAKLAHPNIITIHDVGQAVDSHYIVMEYLPESLNDRIKKTGLPTPKDALDIVKMVAAALQYAHHKGFIHRDIKSDNIMFRADGTVVLVDFGIARAMDSSTQLTRTGMSIGTPHYMSPEQCRGEKIDGRSDIYSLGVQLFELLTGKVPYKAENTAGIILKHIQEPVPRLPGDLSQYQPLIDKMMAKGRGMRIQSGAELIKFIDGLLTARDQHLMPSVPSSPDTEPEVATMVMEQPTIPTMPPTSTDARSFHKPSNRKKWLLPAILVFVAAVAVASVYYFTRPALSSQPSQPTVGEVKNGGSTGPGVEKAGQDTPVEKKEEIKKEETKTATQPETKKEPPVTPVKKEPAKENPKKPEVKQEIPGTQVKTPEVIPKKEIKPEIKPAKPTKTVSILSLAPDLRKTYYERLTRISIQLPRRAVRMRVRGQVALNLFINENGKITINSFRDMVTVTPPRGKKAVQALIRKEINTIFLPPPKNKNGEPLKIKNWRVTFKVGKFGNKIYLTKQK